MVGERAADELAGRIKGGLVPSEDFTDNAIDGHAVLAGCLHALVQTGSG